MKASKVRKLAAARWRTGSAQDFLKLTKEEVVLVDTRLALGLGAKKSPRR